MVIPTLAFAALVSLATATLLVHVGRTVRERDVSPDARLAARMFAVWWMSIGIGIGVIALRDLAVALTAPPGPVVTSLAIAARYVYLLALCVAVWALLYYLVYLFSGRKGTLWPLAAVYGSIFAAIAYFTTILEPAGVRVESWVVHVEYARAQELARTGAAARRMFVFALLLPQILAALAYFSLIFRVRTRAQKFRVAVVSWSLVIWLGSSLLAVTTSLGAEAWWEAGSRLIGLAAAAAVLSAYRTPAWLSDALRLDEDTTRA